MALSDWDSEIDDADDEETYVSTAGRADLSAYRYFFMAEEDRAVIDAWMRKAKCLGAGSELFIPETMDDSDRRGGDQRAETVRAKQVCNGLDGGPVCPVRDECLDYAIREGLWEGVWGGMSQRERRTVSRSRRVSGEVNGSPTPTQRRTRSSGRSGDTLSRRSAKKT